VPSDAGSIPATSTKKYEAAFMAVFVFLWRAGDAADHAATTAFLICSSCMCTPGLAIGE
jgi:hypothetical protein